MEAEAQEKVQPPGHRRLNFASRSQSLKGVQKSYACLKKQIEVTPRWDQILSEIHPVSQKLHMLRLIHWDDGVTLPKIDPAAMVRPQKPELTGQKRQL